MGKYFSKAALLAADDRKYEDVRVPEWGDELVRVRSLTALEKDTFEKSMTTYRREGQRYVAMPNLTNMRGRMVVLCIVDPETKERMFTDSDAALLGAKNSAAVDRIVEACKRLSGWDNADLQKMEEELKNAQPADSLSG
jgi:hypothetical protein